MLIVPLCGGSMETLVWHGRPKSIFYLFRFSTLTEDIWEVCSPDSRHWSGQQQQLKHRVCAFGIRTSVHSCRSAKVYRQINGTENGTANHIQKGFNATT